MITDGDVKKLKGVFATKEDLNKFATKEDLKKSNQELRKDFSDHFASKQDLKEAVRDLKEEMATKAEMRQVATLLDKIAGELKGIREDRILQNRINERVEERLTKIETSRH